MAERKNRNTGTPTQERNLFVTDLEDQFFGNITRELHQDVVQMFVLYFQVDEKLSDYNDIYGETTKLVLKNPLKIDCFVEEEEPTIVNDKFGEDRTKNIIVSIHRRRLDELGLTINGGDYIEWNGFKYLITSAIDSRHVGGVGRFRDSMIVKATIPDTNQSLNV